MKRTGDILILEPKDFEDLRAGTLLRIPESDIVSNEPVRRVMFRAWLIEDLWEAK